MKIKILISVLGVLIALVGWDVQQRVRTKDFAAPIIGTPEIVGREHSMFDQIARRYTSIGGGDLTSIAIHKNALILKFEHGDFYHRLEAQVYQPKPEKMKQEVLSEEISDEPQEMLWYGIKRDGTNDLRMMESALQFLRLNYSTNACGDLLDAKLYGRNSKLTKVVMTGVDAEMTWYPPSTNHFKTIK
jgi:hypothetical protein